MYYVYALVSIKNRHVYIGYSTDVSNRVDTHNAGKVKSTKANVPWELIYYEAFLSKHDATKREYQLKRSSYKTRLKRRIVNSIDESILRSRSQVG